MKKEILQKINNCKSDRISLAQMEINDNDIEEIINNLYQLKPTLTYIDLDRNKLGDKGACLLAQGLCKFDNITELSVQANLIATQGALDLFKLKNKFPDIHIAFRGNKITNVAEMMAIEEQAFARSSIRP